MSTREKAHQLLDRLPESEVGPVLEFIVSRQTKGESVPVAPSPRPRPRVALGRSTDGSSAAITATEPIARPPT